MAHEFWLSNAQWAAIDAVLPKNRPGARRVDDRRVISGIIHVHRSGCRWRDCPAVYGPYTTIYNRWNRWSQQTLWLCLFEALCRVSSAEEFQAIDSTSIKAHRSAAGGKGGLKRRPLAAHAAAARRKSMPSAMQAGAPSRLK